MIKNTENQHTKKPFKFSKKEQREDIYFWFQRIDILQGRTDKINTVEIVLQKMCKNQK